MIYLVLGVGDNSMGEAIAYRLLQENGAQVFIADINTVNLKSTLLKLNNLPRAPNTNLSEFSPKGGLDVINQKEYLPFYFQNCDIVISALPASLNYIIADAVLLTNEWRPKTFIKKTHYCDLGGVLDVTKKIIHWDMKERAKSCGVSLVPDCGLQPGLGNIIAMELLNKFDYDFPLESIIIYVGGLPYNYKEPPYYKKLFNLNGLAALYFESPLVLHNGKPLKITKMSHYEKIPTREFDMYFGTDEIVKFEAAVTGGLGALPYYMQDKVLTLQEKTLRYDGHYNRIKVVPKENFEEIFTHWLEGFPVPEDDFTVMKVIANGISAIKNRRDKIMRIKIEKLLNVTSDKTWTSMQKTTGFTTAVLARLIAEGKAKLGAYPPEVALDPEIVLESLKKDFCIYERTTAQPTLS